MTIVTICSSKGSPGVTTLACAIAATWPQNRRILLAECDPSGGDIAARFGMSAKLGMTSLVLESRSSQGSALPNVEQHLQRLPGGLEVLVGAVGASAARMVDDELPGLTRWLSRFSSDSKRQPSAARTGSRNDGRNDGSDRGLWTHPTRSLSDRWRSWRAPTTFCSRSGRPSKGWLRPDGSRRCWAADHGEDARATRSSGRLGESRGFGRRAGSAG